jgi:hypothetical protein
MNMYANFRMSMRAIATLEETNKLHQEYISQLENLIEVRRVRIIALDGVNKILVCNL